MTQNKTALQEAIKNCEQWFQYLDNQKNNTIKLQQAALLAKKGDREGVIRIKSAVDSTPRVFDGATLLQAVKCLVEAAQAYADLPEKIEGRIRANLIKHQECQDAGNINGMGHYTARNDELKSLLKEM